MTVTHIKKWGNSYGIRIPKEKLEELGILPDDLVEIRTESGHLTVTPIHKPNYTLDELLAQMTDENLHSEIGTGQATGAEEW
jgi:antitoxin MazE